MASSDQSTVQEAATADAAVTIVAPDSVSEVARNEAIKLRATFYNNIAVGLFVGGFLLPYFALFQKLEAILFRPVDQAPIEFNPFDIFTQVALAGIAMGISWYFYRTAQTEIMNIRDRTRTPRRKRTHHAATLIPHQAGHRHHA